MAEGTKQGIAMEPRHVYGPRPVGALVPKVARAALRRFSPASAQILADWDTIIGPAIAAVTSPRRLTSGTLTIACAGPIALELQHLAAEVIGRINTHLGGVPVQRLRFVQVAPFKAAIRVAASCPVSTEDTGAAQRAVADLPEGELRDALAALGSAVSASRAHGLQNGRIR